MDERHCLLRVARRSSLLAETLNTAPTFGVAGKVQQYVYQKTDPLMTFGT